MKKSLLLPVIGALLFGTVIASGLVFQEVLPNTVDDAALEYIQIINVSCTDIEMSGIMISDISAKTYTLPAGILAPGGIRRIPRSESKLILNNSDERLEMRSSTGELLDSLSYAISTRDMPIVSTTYTVQSCIPISPVTPLENTGSLDPSTSSGVSFSGGVTFSGESQTGVTTLEDFFSGSLTSSGS